MSDSIADRPTSDAANGAHAPFRVVVLSSGDEEHILRLVQRIGREVPEARVVGVLSERRGGKSLSSRVSTFLGNLKDPDFPPYVASKVWEGACGQLAGVGAALLRLAHGGGPTPIENPDPMQAFASIGCVFRTTSDYHGDDALAFVRSLNPDLGIVYGTRILKPSLFAIPRLGSINIHKRKVPDYRGGGPVGLWEMLDGQPEIGITVHQVTEKLDAGAIVNTATIPIGPFDTLTSLGLKADVVGNDLLVRSVAELASGTARLTPQQGTGRMFRNPSAQKLARLQKQLASSRPAFRPAASRPTVKMLAKTVLALPGATIRNWKRRRAGRFPVTILFHHLVADRPHRMAQPTEHFLEHVRYLQKFYDVVSLQQAIRMLESGTVRRPTVVLTFDDGYGDNFVSLRAVVEATGVPVTMLVSSTHIDRGTPFAHDATVGEHGFRPFTWAELAQMQAAGFEIGSHTRTHFDCGSTDVARLQNEIAGSKADLERHLGRPIRTFSFPFGLPENISPQAAQLSVRTYPYVMSAFGGDNLPPADGVVRHLRRWHHPQPLWELELQIQGALEPPGQLDEVFALPAAGKSPAERQLAILDRTA